MGKESSIILTGSCACFVAGKRSDQACPDLVKGSVIARSQQ
jgi:hypothetical protein